jgi:FAD/FMN-containing dehydrogenase
MRPSTPWWSRPPGPVSPLTNVILLPGGGAIARVDDNAMAFGQRQTPCNVHYLSMWADPADSDTNIAWSRQLSNAMKPKTTGRVYLNVLGDEGQGRIEAGFGPEKYARLRALKAKWDPTNLFRQNRNIPPAAN